MIRADAWKRVFLPVMRDGKVPGFRVDQSVHRPPVCQDSHSYPGPDGHEDKGIKSVVSRRPIMFAKSSRIDVRIESSRQVKRTCDLPMQIHIIPIRFSCLVVYPYFKEAG